ncbi:MAG: adenosine deaminase [Terriglobia bacterium]
MRFRETETKDLPPAPAHFIRALPKTELHLHLEGSIEPETLRELARSKGRLGEATEAWIREREETSFCYRSCAEFLNAFKLLTLLLESPPDYALATTRLFEYLDAQNIRYAEITLAVGVILWKKQSVPEIFEAVARAAETFCSRSALRVNWIFDAIRHFGADHAREVLGWAKVYRDHGVVAFGIGGDEQRGPAGLFAGVYRGARDAGLHTTAHAGESAGPGSVRAAVELLQAERIGHGLAAAQDPPLMALLRERQVTVEVCLSSNAATGLIAGVRNHPLRRFLDFGIPVTLNTDDPALFATSLDREFEIARCVYGLSPDEIVGILKNSIRASFNPDREKQRLLLGLEEAAAAAVNAEAR